ncbi:MAG TPA: glycoside hydrolase family 2 TIM barrel-domain containing protein [Bryobacteraceae bacterium]|jgi:beta-glucuronidase|nr:glycoside hydrolase family 2 TIM barrel-domain containing protein [Bryobacteraceae bacterium]
MTHRLAVLTLLVARIPIEAQPSSVINVPGRRTISLDGKWRAIVDPYEYGYYDFRMQPTKTGFFLNAHPKDPSDLVEYDFDTSGQLDVPGDWNTQRENLFFYEGTIWYRQLFDYRKKADTRVFLHFGAANYEAIVYLNGEKLGTHTGGFTPFAFEITGKVREKGNFVVVKVDNKRLRDAVPTVNTDWWNYGGLTRSVSLVEVPATFVEDYFVQLKKGSTDTIAGWVKLNGAMPQQRVAIRIPEAGISASVTTDASGRAALNIPAAKLSLWSPSNPKLYEVTIAAETDSVRESIGFRTIETKGLDILLNGKPIFLRGVAIHEEAPFRTGRAYSLEDARTLLGWARELGCNFVRLAHYPHNENMLREADRLGLMVWSETPVYWTISWENAETFANAGNQLAESISRDKNRASIILWSVANETPVLDARNVFLKRLVEQVRAQDPTRLVTAAMMHHSEKDTGQRNSVVIDDPLGADLDVLGCNEYLGWYDGLPEKTDRTDWKSIYDKPLIMSEFGAGALYGRHGDPLAKFTEEYQESVFHHQVAMLNRIPFLRGTSPWVLMDFRSPRRNLPDIQDFFNRKGLVGIHGEKKKAFFVMQEYYKSKQ